MKITLTAPMHGRHATVAKCIERNRAVGIDSMWYCYTNEADRKFLEQYDFTRWTLCHENNIPLKAQQALTFARDEDCDAVIMMGSDDYLDQAAYDLICEKLKYHDYIAFDSIYMESGGGEYYWGGYPEGTTRHGEPAGAGKVIRRDLLGRIGWKVWSDYHVGRTDYTAHKRLSEACKSEHRIECMRDGVRLVDVKDRHSMTPISKIHYLKRLR